MEDKRNKLNTILLIILIVLILVFGIYYIYDSNKNKIDNNKTDNTTTTSKIDNLLNEELKGYKEYDLNTVEERKSIFENRIYDLDSDITRINSALWTYEHSEYKDNTYTYTYNDGEQKKSYTINDVKEVKYYLGDNSYKRIVMVKDNANVIRYLFNDLNDIIDKDFERIEFITLPSKYDDIKLYSEDSQIPYMLVDKEGNYYDLVSRIKINKDTFYKSSEYNISINIDGTVYNDIGQNIRSGIKLKKGIYYQETDELEYFISDDNYLYNRELKKLSEQKIKKVLYYNEGSPEKIYVIFEDNSSIELEYSYL